MATQKCVAGEVVREAIDVRLDAVDRLLLGFIPRRERLAILRSLDDRLRSIAATGPLGISLAATVAPGDAAFAIDEPPRDPLAALAAAAAGEEPAREPVGEWRRRPEPVARRERRSTLAVLSSVLGIGACGLLVGAPVAYFAASTLGDVFGESSAMAILVTYLALILVGSGGAITSGAAALWRLRKPLPGIVGRGWAIAGLCAGPVPFALAGTLAVIIALQMIDAGSGESGSASVSDGEPSEGEPTDANSPEGIAAIATNPTWKVVSIDADSGGEAGDGSSPKASTPVPDPQTILPPAHRAAEVRIVPTDPAPASAVETSAPSTPPGTALVVPSTSGADRLSVAPNELPQPRPQPAAGDGVTPAVPPASPTIPVGDGSGTGP